MRAKADTYVAIMDAFCSGATIEEACRIGGIAQSTYWRWRGECARDPKTHVFTYNGFETNFADAHTIAERKYSETAKKQYYHEALHGRRRKKFFQGESIWAKDPKLVSDALDPETWKLLHGDRPINDVYLRDENGALVQAEEIEPASDAKQLSVLKAIGGAEWRDKTDVNVAVSGGVKIIAPQPKPQPLPAPDLKLIEQMARETVGLPPEPEILEPDMGEDDGPPIARVMNAEPPLPPALEAEPMEMVTTKKTEAPVQASPPAKASALIEDLKRFEARLKDPARQTARPTAPINTGVPPKHRDDPP